MDKPKRINRAPNLLLILLWHHSCYYKRHYIVFVLTLLMPFLVISLLFALSYYFNASLITEDSILKMPRYGPCNQQTTASITSGPFHFSSTYDCKRVPEKVNRNSSWCPANWARCELSRTCVKESDYFEASLSDKSPYCSLPNQGNTRPFEPDYYPACQCSSLNDGMYVYSDQSIPSMTDRCSFLRGRIVYYPNSSTLINDIMGKVKDQINTLGNAIAIIANNSLDLQTRKDLWPAFDLLALAKKAECFENANDRVIGFANRQDMLEYVKWMNDSQERPYNGNGYHSPSLHPPQILWAALNFEGNNDDQKAFRYSIMKATQELSQFHDEREDIWIQDVLESAIVMNKLNLSKSPVSPMWKELPSKCWIRPNEYFYMILLIVLPIGCVYAFIFCPINFLEQVLTEKQLKLREYLSIVGVNDVTLKLSWIVFYMIFTIPASIGCAIYVHFLYGNSMAHTDPTILIVQFVLFNLSQLFLSYFLSSFMKEPRRVSFILVFLNMLPSMFAVLAFYFSGQQLHGVFLVVFRIASLHCAVPFVLSLCYVVQWELAWVGGRWSNLFYSVNLGDGYYGFGEGIMWMLGDCVLYLLLAWYLQNIMPGEYGVKRKSYFVFQPSYWMPKRFGDLNEIDAAKMEMGDLTPDIEHRGQPDDRKPTLVIEKLTKFYNKQKTGVDRLSLAVYRNEITALLGQNGAGKSTTMNTLVGLLTPTAGRFTVAGLECDNQMGEIKKLLGFVPQYDILYPSMTVEEHLQFFGWLKGMDKKQIKTIVHPLLDKFGMSHLKSTITTNLSGGQKRKLSILTAYMGEPELVILDEPTTGVDPFSRRSIWDVLLHHRLTTATIVSTHFMDEADLLSDRIAIISEGTLRCVGSPMYLKNKYGQGFRIIAACSNEPQAIEDTKKFFSSRDAGIQLTQTSGRDLTFTVPKEYARSPEMVSLLKSIEIHKQEIGIQSFGISEPTLEEAFFAAAEVDPAKIQRHAAADTDGEGHNRLRRQSSVTIKYTNRTGILLWFHQFAALFKKRLLLAYRTPSAILMQNLYPLTFIIILLLTSNEIMQSGQAKIKPIHIYQSYRTNVLFVQEKTTSPEANSLFSTLIQRGLGPRCPGEYSEFKCGTQNAGGRIDDQKIDLSTNRKACECDGYCPEGNSLQIQNWMTPSSDKVYALPSSIDAADWILAANQSDHWILGGFQFHNRSHNFNSGIIGRMLANTTSDAYTIIWTRSEYKMAMLNAYNNLLLQTFSSDKNAKIEAYFEELRFPSPQDDAHENTRTMAGEFLMMFVGVFLLILAFTFATFGISVEIQQEKIGNLKELQYVSGAMPSAYWLANFLWDFIQYMITFAIIMILLAIFKNPLTPLLGHFINILIPYGLGAVGFIYLISFRFKSSTAINKVIMACGILSKIAGSMLTMFEFNYYMEKHRQMRNPSPYDREPSFGWSITVNYVLRFVPFYTMADGCFLINIVNLFKQIKFGSPEDLELYKTELLGKRIIQGYAVAFFWIFFVIVLEQWRNGLFSCGKGGAKIVEIDADQPYQIPAGVDPDVHAEERRVLSAQSTDEPVVVKKVTQKYKNHLAVDAVTFGIPRSQCFGLLGVNGAGKTTLFRIMTGFQPPTSGQAFIENSNVVTQKMMLARNISYCPQENTLFDKLSVREHIRLFAALRGVPFANVDTMVESLIEEVGLESHAHKLSKELSGGNKRKLNFALALLDYKPVIFLDEPTSGMDPGARRRTWTCIENAVRKGCSVVLTSHSMDECEALCHRLVIMARGKICCIGSIQYLKDKFGNRYTIKIKLTNANVSDESRASAIQQLKLHISNTISDSHLIEEHGTMLQYETGGAANGLRLSSLFGSLSECRRLSPDLVEDFTLSQVTLERVFVSMAQRQQDQQNNPHLVNDQRDAVVYVPVVNVGMTENDVA